jgi:hypothetical protein
MTTTTSKDIVARSLNDLLEQDDDAVPEGVLDSIMQNVDSSNGDGDGGSAVNDFGINQGNHVPSSQGMCTECGDQVSAVLCEQCEYVHFIYLYVVVYYCVFVYSRVMCVNHLLKLPVVCGTS